MSKCDEKGATEKLVYAIENDLTDIYNDPEKSDDFYEKYYDIFINEIENNFGIKITTNIDNGELFKIEDIEDQYFIVLSDEFKKYLFDIISDYMKNNSKEENNDVLPSQPSLYMPFNSETSFMTYSMRYTDMATIFVEKYERILKQLRNDFGRYIKINSEILVNKSQYNEKKIKEIENAISRYNEIIKKIEKNIKSVRDLKQMNAISNDDFNSTFFNLIYDEISELGKIVGYSYTLSNGEFSFKKSNEKTDITTQTLNIDKLRERIEALRSVLNSPEKEIQNSEFEILYEGTSFKWDVQKFNSNLEEIEKTEIFYIKKFIENWINNDEKRVQWYIDSLMSKGYSEEDLKKKIDEYLNKVKKHFDNLTDITKVTKNFIGSQASLPADMIMSMKTLFIRQELGALMQSSIRIREILSTLDEDQKKKLQEDLLSFSIDKSGNKRYRPWLRQLYNEKFRALQKGITKGFNEISSATQYINKIKRIKQTLDENGITIFDISKSHIITSMLNDNDGTKDIDKLIDEVINDEKRIHTLRKSDYDRLIFKNSFSYNKILFRDFIKEQYQRAIIFKRIHENDVNDENKKIYVDLTEFTKAINEITNVDENSDKFKKLAKKIEYFLENRAYYDLKFIINDVNTPESQSLIDVDFFNMLDDKKNPEFSEIWILLDKILSDINVTYSNLKKKGYNYIPLLLETRARAIDVQNRLGAGKIELPSNFRVWLARNINTTYGGQSNIDSNKRFRIGTRKEFSDEMTNAYEEIKSLYNDKSFDEIIDDAILYGVIDNKEDVNEYINDYLKKRYPYNLYTFDNGKISGLRNDKNAVKFQSEEKYTSIISTIKNHIISEIAMNISMSYANMDVIENVLNYADAAAELRGLRQTEVYANIMVDYIERKSKAATNQTYSEIDELMMVPDAKKILKDPSKLENTLDHLKSWRSQNIYGDKRFVKDTDIWDKINKLRFKARNLIELDLMKYNKSQGTVEKESNISESDMDNMISFDIVRKDDEGNEHEYRYYSYKDHDSPTPIYFRADKNFKGYTTRYTSKPFMKSEFKKDFDEIINKIMSQLKLVEIIKDFKITNNKSGNISKINITIHNYNEDNDDVLEYEFKNDFSYAVFFTYLKENNLIETENDFNLSNNNGIFILDGSESKFSIGKYSFEINMKGINNEYETKLEDYDFSLVENKYEEIGYKEFSIAHDVFNNECIESTCSYCTPESILRGIKSDIAYVNLTFSPKGGIRNRMEGLLKNITCGISGRFGYDSFDLDKASRFITRINSMHRHTNEGEIVVDKLSNTIKKGKRFRYEQLKIYEKFIYGLSIFQSHVCDSESIEESSYGWINYLKQLATNVAENKNQGEVAMAVLYNMSKNKEIWITKKDKNGNIIKDENGNPKRFEIFDSYGNFEIYENSNLELKPEYDTPENRRTWQQFFDFDMIGRAVTKIDDAIKSVHGNYSTYDKAKYRGQPLVDIFMLFKTYLPNHMWQEYGIKDFDFMTGEEYIPGRKLLLARNAPTLLSYIGMMAATNIPIGGWYSSMPYMFWTMTGSSLVGGAIIGGASIIKGIQDKRKRNSIIASLEQQSDTASRVDRIMKGKINDMFYFMLETIGHTFALPVDFVSKIVTANQFSPNLVGLVHEAFMKEWNERSQKVGMTALSEFERNIIAENCMDIARFMLIRAACNGIVRAVRALTIALSADDDDSEVTKFIKETIIRYLEWIQNTALNTANMLANDIVKYFMLGVQADDMKPAVMMLFETINKFNKTYEKYNASRIEIENRRIKYLTRMLPSLVRIIPGLTNQTADMLREMIFGIIGKDQKPSKNYYQMSVTNSLGMILGTPYTTDFMNKWGTPVWDWDTNPDKYLDKDDKKVKEVKETKLKDLRRKLINDKTFNNSYNSTLVDYFNALDVDIFYKGIYGENTTSDMFNKKYKPESISLLKDSRETKDTILQNIINDFDDDMKNYEEVRKDVMNEIKQGIIQPKYYIKGKNNVFKNYIINHNGKNSDNGIPFIVKSGKQNKAAEDMTTNEKIRKKSISKNDIKNWKERSFEIPITKEELNKEIIVERATYFEKKYKLKPEYYATTTIVNRINYWYDEADKAYKNNDMQRFGEVIKILDDYYNTIGVSNGDPYMFITKLHEKEGKLYNETNEKTLRGKKIVKFE